MSMDNQGKQKLADDFFSTLEQARLPMQYLAGLFAGGNEEEVKAVYQKLIAVRIQRRHISVGDISARTSIRLVQLPN